MKTLKPSIIIALRALRRKKLQTALTIVGITVGVATVLTMIALGAGAESSIEDQVRAAGMNMIVVTAGNYKTKTDDQGGAVEEQGRLVNLNYFIPAVYAGALMGEPRLYRRGWGRMYNRSPFIAVFHPEDDPMEKHDHPTASQRLGDMEAGLGAAATLTSGDADAIRRIKGVQYVSEGIHSNVHITADAKRWFTRLHGDDVSLPMIRRAWIFEHGRFFSRREESNGAQVAVLGSVAAEKLFGSENPVGKKISIWKQPFEVVGVV
ncbi:MAG: ABC transporter permease, partial [Acidobacteriia bacterium]|nr:ABC transporter permease [Terriglobia bacterium]